MLSNAGRFEQAEKEARRAVDLAADSQDPWTGSNALNELGIIANCTNRYADGETHLIRAIEAFRADGNRPGEASALCNLSRVLAPPWAICPGPSNSPARAPASTTNSA
ncbi:hypothetical protein GCM10020256_43760 [Streptomyces thermocoprophilus]